MNRSTTYTFAALVVLAGAAYGCKDFLVAPPQGSLNELSLQSAAGVEATLIGAYRMLGGNTNFASAPSNWALASVPSDDAYKGSDPTDQAQINDLELYFWGGDGAEAYLNDKWSAMYEGVNRANSTLRLLDQVQKQQAGAMSQAEASAVRGQALFLRAFFHSEAWRLWQNIPYYKESDTDVRKANVQSAEVVKLILADLDEAAKLLGPTPYNGEKGRVTQWTAKAYKGRVLAQDGQYPAALAVFKDVIANGPYALEKSFDRVWTGFKQYENGPETILAYEASANDGNPNGDNANFGERLNFPHSGSPFGCCGFHQPSQNLVNFYRVDPASGLPLAITPDKGGLEPLQANRDWNANDVNFTADNKAPVDPRLDWTVGRDGVPFKDWGAHAPGWIRDPNRSGPYSPKKNIHEKASGAQSNVGWVNTQLNSVNIHIFRYADLLLLAAEAMAETGDLEGARQIVNQVRARAGQTAQGPGTSAANIAVPINDPSITWATYKVGLYPSFPSKAYALSAVHYERRLELAMEGQRLFDLRRWKESPEVLNSYIAVEQRRRPYLGAAKTVKLPEYNYYPIPSRQIELSKVGNEKRLQQNPGW